MDEIHEGTEGTEELKPILGLYYIIEFVTSTIHIEQKSVLAYLGFSITEKGKGNSWFRLRKKIYVQRELISNLNAGNDVRDHYERLLRVMGVPFNGMFLLSTWQTTETGLEAPELPVWIKD